MTRRELLKLLTLGAISQYTLDIDKLLWVPDKKTIFLPSLTESKIIAIELERLLPHIKDLFNRDDIFFQILKNRKIESISNRPFQVPFELE